MYTDCSKYDTSVLRIRIELSKSGRRAFNRLNAKLGQAYIRFFQLERDLAEYIERHIDSLLCTVQSSCTHISVCYHVLPSDF